MPSSRGRGPPRTPGTTTPGCSPAYGSRHCAASTGGLSGVSSRRGRARSTSTSTAGGCTGSRRPPVPSPRRRCRGCSSRCPVAEVPTRAQVVVVGGGVVGCSTAYHLTKLGWTDVLVLEQGHLSGGTTWHAAGLVGPLRATEAGTRLVQYSAELYASLEAETGLATGYLNVGGLIVARTEDRMVQLRRTAANAAAYDLDCELLTADEAGKLWPPMRIDDLLGAIWLPGDGKVNPTDLTQSLARGARQAGASVLEGVRVTGFEIEDGPAGRRVTGVRTDHGDVETEAVVLCAGQWSKA